MARFTAFGFRFGLLLALLAFGLTQDACRRPTDDNPQGCIDPHNVNPNYTCNTFAYQPVCGCDGKTYESSCEAQYKYGVRKWKDGPCPGTAPCVDPSKVRKGRPCTQQFEPVCGCDGVTYSNVCVAENAGLVSWKPGKCPTGAACIDTALRNRSIGLMCVQTYEPVCGCDGKTYSNPCYAKKAGVTAWKQGVCPVVDPTPCIDPNHRHPETVLCPPVYEPVCGCDGKTYPNDCIAKANGLTSWKKGACPDATN